MKLSTQSDVRHIAGVQVVQGVWPLGESAPCFYHKMKEDNYIVIQGWMRTRLRLRGNDLICFALLYGFSQDGASEFRGSHRYIREATGVATDQSVLNIIKRLEDMGLVTKTTEVSGGVKSSSYKAYSQPLKNREGVLQNLEGGSLKIREGGSLKIRDNIIDNININIKESTPKGVPKKSPDLQERIKIERDNFRKELERFKGMYSEDMLEDFAGYWCEPFRNPIGNKLIRWQGEKTWDMARRLTTWARVDAEKRGRQRPRFNKPTPLPTKIDFNENSAAGDEAPTLLEVAPDSEYAYQQAKRAKMREALERSKRMANGNNNDGLTILTHGNNR